MLAEIRFSSVVDLSRRSNSVLNEVNDMDVPMKAESYLEKKCQIQCFQRKQDKDQPNHNGREGSNQSIDIHSPGVYLWGCWSVFDASEPGHN